MKNRLLGLKIVWVVSIALFVLTGTVLGEATYSITGQIRFERGDEAVGVIVTDDAGHTTTTISPFGEYTLSNLPPGTYTITPTKTGCTFTPPSRRVTISASNVIDINFTATLHSFPSYAWHTFYGSSDYEYGYAIALDSHDNIYITGRSIAAWGTPLHSGGDVYVLKLDRNGNYLWHTFYGLNGEGNNGSGIALDGSGNIYVVGSSTASWGDPLHPFTPGVYPNQTDAFLLKLDANGNYLWHTFYGGSGYDYGNDLAINSSNQVILVGQSDTTWGTPRQAHAGYYDAFALKLDSDGNYVWHTFQGGSGRDDGNAVTLDQLGNIYLAGHSYDHWGSPVAPNGVSQDILVSKLDSSGTYLWHTFHGGVGRDTGFDIGLDGSGNIYVTGSATTGWGTPLNPYGESMQDMVVLKLNSGGVYQWHTFYGYGWSAGNELVVDQNANLYIIGHTSGDWGMGLHEFSGDYEIVLLRLDSNGIPLWYTFYGGYGAANGADYGRAIALGQNNAIYLTGYAKSSEPEDEEWRAALHDHSGGADIVVLKLGGDTLTGLKSSASVALYGQPVQFTATVRPVVGAGVPTGQVQFLKNGSSWGEPVELSNGVAISLPIPNGSYTITAFYSGDPHFSNSVSFKLNQSAVEQIYPTYLSLVRR